MFSTSPEDRLMQVRHLQNEQRAQAASERIASATEVDRTGAMSAAPATSSPHTLLERTTHVLRAVSRPHAFAGHRAR